MTCSGNKQDYAMLLLLSGQGMDRDGSLSTFGVPSMSTEPMGCKKPYRPTSGKITSRQGRHWQQ